MMPLMSAEAVGPGGVERWAAAARVENVPSTNSGGAESADAVHVVYVVGSRKLMVEIKVPRKFHVARAAPNEKSCVDCAGVCFPKLSAFS